MGVSKFDVLKEMSKQNKDIRLFPSGNLKNVKTGKDGWGSVEMAIDNQTAQRIMDFSDKERIMYFFMFVDYAQFLEVQSDIEKDEKWSN